MVRERQTRRRLQIRRSGLSAEHRLALVGFDTATDDVAVCAWRDGDVLYEALLGPSDQTGPIHTAALLEHVERAASAAGGWEAIERVAVGCGPGSFTGLRVGLATARGLGLSRGLSLSGVCTLDPIGRAIGEIAGDAERLAVTDARRGEVFSALYSSAGERVWGPDVSSPEELAERVAAMANPPLAAGSGAVRFRAQLASRGIEVPEDADPVHRIAARHICALAATGRVRNDSDPVAPIYLRPPDAERWRERDSLQKPN